MRRECKMVYTYDELSDKAKEKAREWWSSLVFSDSCDWEFVYEDAVRMGKLMGIEISSSPVRLMGGGARLKPDIYFSGFSSQGDGACFEGSYRYKKGAVEAIKKETGFGFKGSDGVVGKGDAELTRIAKGLQEVQRKHFYKLSATCTHRGHYTHSGCMDVDVEHYDGWRDLKGDDEQVRQLLRDFADWIYRQLEAEYDYQCSDEAVEEILLNNPYEFYENGERV